MKKLFISRIIGHKLILLFALLFLQSCSNNDKEFNNSFFKMESTAQEHVIDFNIIDRLNELNQKNIKLSVITFASIKDVKTLQLLLKIKKDHKNIDSDLKNLTKKNLIVIPKLIYHININSDSLNTKNNNVYLLQLLEKEIESEITILNQIEKTSQNVDFKTFALQSINKLKNNNDVLKSVVNLK